ncbi:hypothetical protein CBD41_06715 [bacterium TMED181]|nr:MAG: hypothetical protein CBD41_06715 [bacterium TMED181]
MLNLTEAHTHTRPAVASLSYSAAAVGHGEALEAQLEVGVAGVDVVRVEDSLWWNVEVVG